VSFAVSGAVARSLAVVALASTFALSLAFGTPAPVAQAGGGTEAQRIVSTAQSYLGGKWVYAATGPNNFDCSGLVFRVYKDNGLLDRIGGKRRTVSGFYKWFKNRGMVSRKNPRVGDLIVWGNFKHIGVYIGDGMAISTLTSGVKKHRVHGLTDPFKAYLHVNLER
jgi:peptidoglycan DL-endopeptidase CwlO